MNIQTFLLPKDAPKALENARWRRIVIERLLSHQEKWRKKGTKWQWYALNFCTQQAFSRGGTCHTRLKTPHPNHGSIRFRFVWYTLTSKKEAEYRKPSLETNSSMTKSKSYTNRQSIWYSHRNPLWYCLLSATRKLYTHCKHNGDLQVRVSISALLSFSIELRHNLYMPRGVALQQ